MTQPDDRVRRQNEGLRSGFRRLVQSRYGLLLFGLLALLVLAVVILMDYGASIDEVAEAEIGRVFLSAYQTGRLVGSPTIDSYHGPFYFMVFTLTSQFFHRLHPSWLLTDGLHLTNFITFLVGIFFFYRIALRLLPRGSALFVTALFTTQPVFFGHAFINQKDTPLMAFFLASVELGWTAVEARVSVEPRWPDDAEEPERPVGIVEQWRRLSARRRILIWGGGLLGLIVLLDLWWFGGVQSAARSLLGEIYVGRGPAFLVDLFGRIAEDAYKTPLSAYVAKLDRALSLARVVATFMIAAGALVLWRLALPVSFSNALGLRLPHQLAKNGVKTRWALLVAAGCVLGLTTSIRVLAPFAGLLVAAYWIGCSGRRALPGIVAYGLVAVLMTYLTWPMLWGNPLAAFTPQGLHLSRFARHDVLFQGVIYSSGDLPWQYLPVLLAIQLTLPALLLFLMGAAYSWRFTARDWNRRLMLVLIWIWLALPTAASALGWVPIYNNFRLVLFALPPAFLIMGYAVWRLFEFLRSPALRTAVVVVALAPGVLGIVRLHPYEYIYYNELVGGVRGAEGKFDLDYWCTALRAAMVEVNQAAAPGDRIVIAGRVRTAEPFVRADLQLMGGSDGGTSPAFALACRRDLRRPSFFPEMETAYEVRAGDALLAVVKQAR